MSTRKHVHQESFPTTVESLFSLLVTPTAICNWWGAARAIVIAEKGGVWAAVWGASEDDPDYVTTANIREFEVPHRMILADYRYRARQPLPFAAEFTTEFLVSEVSGGASLCVTQHGFPVSPEADAFYESCEVGWQATFAGIRRFLGNVSRDKDAGQRGTNLARLFRVILPVADIARAAEVYSKLFQMSGHRVSAGRHYFDCGGTILACYDAAADGDGVVIPTTYQPGQYIYIAVRDVERTLESASQLSFHIESKGIQTMPWGERMFWAKDPFGNPISFVQQGTEFLGGSTQ